MAIEPVTREERFLVAAGGRSVTPPTPITRKEQLLQGIIDAVKSGGATPDVIVGAVNDYLNANPVKPGATAEQATQIEQNKTDIADLQAEIEDKQPKGDYVKTVNGNKPDATGNVVVATGGNGSGQNVELDSSLTQSGKAADAKATGDEIKRVEGKIPSIEGLAKSEDIPTRPEDIGAQPEGNYASPDDIPKVPNWAMQASKPAYTASEVGADPKGTAASSVSSHNTNNAAHNDIRLLIEGLTTRFNALANSTDTDLDQMAELVAYIKSNKSLIDGITTSKVSVSDIINNLTTNVADKPLSAAQGVALKTLIDAITIPTKVSQLTNDKGYLTQHQDISGKADKTGLTLGIHTDGLVYLFVDGAPVGAGIELTEAGVSGYVADDGTIVLTGLVDGEHTIAYEQEDGTLVVIGKPVVDNNVYFGVTNNLTNCTNSNSATKAVQGEPYSATITAVSGYELKSVTVTMGGSPVSVSGGTISIASVTGNIVITAVAEEIKAAYTNLADPTSADWQEGYRLSISSGSTSVLAGHTVTNYIPTKAGAVLRVKGLKIVGYLADAATDNSNAAKIVMYNASKTKLGGLYGTTNSDGTTGYGSVVDVSGDITTHTILIGNDGTTQNATASCAYIRIDGELMDGYTKNEVVITINEEIM